MKQQSKKYLVLILLVAVLVTPSFALASWYNPFSWHWNNIWDYFSQKQTPTTQILAPTAKTTLAFSSLVEGCAKTGNEANTKSIIVQQNIAPKIEINGNIITYSRAIRHLCNRKAELQNEVSGSNINIYETWSGVGAKCECFSKIEAQIKNLIPAGEYTINVYQRGTDNSGKNPMPQTLLTTKIFNAIQ